MAIHTGKDAIPLVGSNDFSSLTQVNRRRFTGTVDALKAETDFSIGYKKLFLLCLELLKSSATTDRFKIKLQAISNLITKYTKQDSGTTNTSPLQILSSEPDYSKDIKLQTFIRKLKPTIIEVQELIKINPQALQAAKQSSQTASLAGDTLIVDKTPVGITDETTERINEEQVLNALGKLAQKLTGIKDLGEKVDVQNPNAGFVIDQDHLLYQLHNGILVPVNSPGGETKLFDLTHMEQMPLVAMMGVLDKLAQWKALRQKQGKNTGLTAERLNRVFDFDRLATRLSNGTDSNEASQARSSLVRSLHGVGADTSSLLPFDSGSEFCAICEPGGTV